MHKTYHGVLFKFLIVLIVFLIILDSVGEYAALHLLWGWHLFYPTLLMAAFTLFLYAVAITLCILKRRIAFLYLLLLTTYALISVLTSGITYEAFNHTSLFFQVALLVECIIFIVAIIGLIATRKIDYNRPNASSNPK